MHEGDDAETGMRRDLGLGTAFDPDPAIPSSNDPMKAAPQAIRSQAARDYAERELVHAEATIQELRAKLHRPSRRINAGSNLALDPVVYFPDQLLGRRDHRLNETPLSSSSLSPSALRQVARTSLSMVRPANAPAGAATHPDRAQASFQPLMPRWRQSS